jgi:hypothetical protein
MPVHHMMRGSGLCDQRCNALCQNPRRLNVRQTILHDGRTSCRFIRYDPTAVRTVYGSSFFIPGASFSPPDLPLVPNGFYKIPGHLPWRSDSRTNQTMPYRPHVDQIRLINAAKADNVADIAKFPPLSVHDMTLFSSCAADMKRDSMNTSACRQKRLPWRIDGVRHRPSAPRRTEKNCF